MTGISTKIEKNSQIIILDNKNPSNKISSEINHVEFTGDPTSGRQGFFPL
jgi:hypothetical protein